MLLNELSVLTELMLTMQTIEVSAFEYDESCYKILLGIQVVSVGQWSFNLIARS